MPPSQQHFDGHHIDIAMSDVEMGEKSAAEVTITSVDASVRPVLGRRKTSSGIDGETLADHKLGYEGGEDALTKVGNFLWKIHNASILTRYALYILPVAALLAIPLVLTATIYKHSHAQGIRLLGLFIWLEVIWVALWLCKLVASAAPVVFQAICGVISTGIRKYSLVLTAVEIPISLFLWSIVAFSTTNIINVFNKGVWAGTWLETLSTVFKALIIVAAIFLAEKTFVQLVSINYHRKQYDQKIKESKRLIRMLDILYDASRAIFPEYCREFEEEDATIQGNTLTEMRHQLAQAGIKTKVFDDMGRVRDKVIGAFGAMASDITGKQVGAATSAHSIVLEALETEVASKAIARRIWLSFVGEGHEVLYQHDLTQVLGRPRAEMAEEMFHILDRDGNGDVSLEEMTTLLVDVAQERKDRAASMHDISQAIAVLDRLLSLFVVVLIGIIYASYFSKSFNANASKLWGGLVGLGFALGGTVTEFLACCIFLFIKHPYDVGDRVDINDVELVVEHMSLMYSVFRRVDNGKTVQIPHNVANAVWIENVNRSGPMKERISLNVSPSTSMEDVLALRSELEKFVTAPENKRDYQSDLDIELRNLNDLGKLELRVEIRHKSNFANDQLRNARRNRFMVELLASTRRIPIGPPGGLGPAFGDPANPTYSVSISEREALEFKSARKSEDEGKRLFPKGTGGMEGLAAAEGVSSGVQNPASAMISGLIARRSGSVAEGVRGIDDVLPKKS
ncbi:hypothetical protein LTR62_003470 [Meristemomyces frigidus]|uniref:Mechanosensitive ion channel protein n=1 Tax=Meristemomyces frigidus TaxID=1508187 RepID=A0AAN7TIN0_9PEZI|nr:hypothetical protein LTR62_003470 [Meristemomyces frigidus]